MHRRWLLALPKNTPPEEEQQLTEEILDAVRAAAPEGFRLELVNSSQGWEDFQSRDAGGGYEGWAQDVARGLVSATREPRYHVVVLAHRQLGKGNGQLVQAVLAAGKPVFLFERGAFIKVTSCVAIDPADFRTGWQAVTG